MLFMCRCELVMKEGEGDMGRFIDRRTGNGVEAVQFFPDSRPWPEGVRDYSNDVVVGGAWGVAVGESWVKLLQPGDWVITKNSGEHDVCRQEVFAEHYATLEEFGLVVGRASG